MIRFLEGDCLAALRTLPDASAQTAVTSPPYFGLRDYGVDGQIGLEDTPEAFVARLVEVFREVRRVLRDDGTLWLNIGDSYAGSWGAQGKRVTPEQEGWRNSIENHPKMRRTGSRDRFGEAKEKDLIGIPWMLAFALRADGWYLRRDIIWAKPNAMPESVRDRPTSAHEYVFLLTKRPTYFYDADAIAEAAARPEGSGNSQRKLGDERGRPGHHMGGSIPWKGQTRNARSVWTIPTQPFSAKRLAGWTEDHDHYAVMPPDLAERCIKAGTSERGACPHCGAAWRRITERREPEATGAAIGGDPARQDGGQRERDPTGAGGNHRAVKRMGTDNWTQGCDCPAHDPVPQVVLDPFGGAGTTGVVADRLGRDGILIEINPKNVRLARARLMSDAPLLAAAE